MPTPDAWLQPVTLRSEAACLVPLDASHHDDLLDAIHDGDLSALWYTHVPKPADLHGEIERRLDAYRARQMLPFTVIEPHSGRAVGMTTFMHVDERNRRVEIGGTWYRRAVQRSALNTSCKLLLLTHAFEVLDCIAVELRTHFFNQQSRRAIERLGAKLDGVLRNHQRAGNGTLRDTCVYSIIHSEWPTVQAHLMHQLSRPRGNT